MYVNISFIIFSTRSFRGEDAEYTDTTRYINNSEGQDETADVILGNQQQNKTTVTRSSLLAQLAILLGVAATITLLSICLKQPNQGSSSGIQILAGSSSTSAVSTVGFSFNAFGYKIILPEYTPGYMSNLIVFLSNLNPLLSYSCINLYLYCSCQMDLFLAADGCRMWTFYKWRGVKYMGVWHSSIHLNKVMWKSSCLLIYKICDLECCRWASH